MASLATAALLGSAIGSIVGLGVQAGAAVAGGAGARTDNVASGAPPALSYFSDMLFRKDGGTTTTANGSTAASPAPTESAAAAVAAPQQPQPQLSAEQDAAEIGRILMNAGRAEALPPADVRRNG